MSLDKYSWGNRANARLEDYYTSKDLIKGEMNEDLMVDQNQNQFFFLLIQNQNLQQLSAAVAIS